MPAPSPLNSLTREVGTMLISHLPSSPFCLSFQGSMTDNVPKWQVFTSLCPSRRMVGTYPHLQTGRDDETTESWAVTLQIFQHERRSWASHSTPLGHDCPEYILGIIIFSSFSGLDEEEALKMIISMSKAKIVTTNGGSANRHKSKMCNDIKNVSDV